MGKRVLVAIITFILMIACVPVLCACNDKEGDIVSIKATAGILKSTYDVDEAIDFETLSVEVTYQSGAVKTVDKDIVVTGFDTATTGRKKMTISYLDKYFVEYEYEVIYKTMPSQSITTTARLLMEQRPYPTGVSREVKVKVGDLSRVEAVYFTVETSESLKGVGTETNATTDKYECETLINGWDYRLTVTGDKTLKVIVYRSGGNIFAKDGALVALNFFAMKDSFTAQIKDVTITDGEQEYVLPNTAAV